VLRRDDGFGVTLADRLRHEDLPECVHVIESGIAGIALVQELLAGYDAFLVLDVAMRDKPPGTLVMLEPRVPDAAGMTEMQRKEFFADMHQAEPSKAFMLAKALGCLPPRVRILVCEPADCDELIPELSPAVAKALPNAVRLVRETVDEWLADMKAADEVTV
jgi:hydrogenase maturation protease